MKKGFGIVFCKPIWWFFWSELYTRHFELVDLFIAINEVLISLSASIVSYGYLAVRGRKYGHSFSHCWASRKFLLWFRHHGWEEILFYEVLLGQILMVDGFVAWLSISSAFAIFEYFDSEFLFGHFPLTMILRQGAFSNLSLYY